MRRSEIFRSQRKARQLRKNCNPLLSKKKHLSYTKPSLKEVNLRRSNPIKTSLDRLHFGTFSPYNPLPATLELGVNREASINHSTKKVFRMPWKSKKEEKEIRRKEREKEHLALERRTVK